MHYLSKVLLLGIFALSFSAANYAKAESNHCPRQSVKTELRSKLAKTKIYKGTVSGFNDYLGNHDRSQGTVLAFVETDYSELFVQLSYQFESVSIGGGRSCVQLKKVRGDFYAAPALYMPADYRKGSCEYKEILKHEKRHLQEVYDYHDRNKGRYASFLGRVAQRVEIYPSVTSTEDANKVKAQIISYFEESFHQQQLKSMTELAQAQQKIDSPMEYRGVSMRCDNW